MGQILHKCAKTTIVIRIEIQKSIDRITYLAKKLRIVLTKIEGKAMKGRGKFVDYKIGFVHIRCD